VSLEALAPDQRAVVQLVLQQERTYDELAGLLSISSEAVRARAHAGLDRLAGSASLGDEDRAELADYLLGQQSVSGREATRRLLSSSPEARSWATAVAEQLRDVARSPLPEIPEGGDAGFDTETTSVAIDDLDLGEEDADEDEAPSGTVTPARPRPRPRPATATPARPDRPAGAGRDKPRSSLIGGALLLLGLGLVVAAILVAVLSGDDEGGEDGASNGTATPTATATPAVQPAGRIELRAPRGGRARGEMVLYISESNQVAFTLEGSNVPASRSGEAYAVWLTGGDEPHRLGFAPPVTGSGEDRGRLGTSGPRDQDAQNFPRWFADATHVVLSRETTQDARRPGPVVLRGEIPGGGGQG
jgi:hypothetical protein